MYIYTATFQDNRTDMKDDTMIDDVYQYANFKLI